MPTTKEELLMILQEGEGYRIEFKENLSGLDKEMVAFANGSGGRIFIGIQDDGTLQGVNITNSLKSQIVDTARNLDPSVKVILEELENILIINVREGTDKPYRASSGFYNRIGPNSQKLKRDEILEFVKTEGKIRFDELHHPDFGEGSFSNGKLSNFLGMAGISPGLEPKYILKNLGVAEIQEGKLLYNNTGVLFFAANLTDFFYHTTVTCALYKGLDKATVLGPEGF
jgi:ATP-dependent DNA helicase RecG